MKTVLFTTTHLDGLDRQGNNRFDRTVEFLKYYINIKPHFYFDNIMLLDNGSTIWKLEMIRYQFSHLYNINIDYVTFPELHSPSPVGHGATLVYPYLWRALNEIPNICQSKGFDKALCLDNDAYILTSKMCDYINNINSGINTFFASDCNFPETAIMCICKDKFDSLKEQTNPPFEQYNHKLMERVLKFDNVNTTFIGARYGEHIPPKPQTPEMDFYCQRPLNIPMTFNLTL